MDNRISVRILKSQQKKIEQLKINIENSYNKPVSYNKLFIVAIGELLESLENNPDELDRILEKYMYI